MGLWECAIAWVSNFISEYYGQKWGHIFKRVTTMGHIIFWTFGSKELVGIGFLREKNAMLQDKKERQKTINSCFIPLIN